MGDADDGAELVGLWRLESAEHMVDGVRVYPFGPAPIGSLLITADGAVSCHVARGDARSSGGGEERPIHERLFVVWGRWSIAGSLLVIDVAGGAEPALIGSVQRRRYTLAGASLTLANLHSTDLPNAPRYSICWTRAQ